MIEPEPTRDHTERMLRPFRRDGHASSREPAAAARITVEGQPELTAAPIVVPGDPSSAAFPLVAALIVPGSEVTIDECRAQPDAHRAASRASPRWAPTSPSRTGARRAASRSPICGCAPGR